MTEYDRRNRLHAKSVGIVANATAALARIDSWAQPPGWLVVALAGIQQRGLAVSEEMARHRDETKETDD